MVILLTLLFVQAALADSVRGNLIYASSQKPVSDARVTVTDDHGVSVVHTTTDMNGEFFLPSLKPGIYRIVVFASTRGTLILSERISVVQGEDTELYFEVGPKRTLWGQIARDNYM